MSQMQQIILVKDVSKIILAKNLFLESLKDYLRKGKPFSGIGQMQQIILFWDVSKIIFVKEKPFLGYLNQM